MGFDFLSRAAKFLQERKEYRRWLTAFVGLALVVVFGTVTALRMYGQAMTHQVKTLHCAYQVHEHSEACYEEDEEGKKTLGCGLADYVVHVHNDDCYDEKQNMVCPLEEHLLHEHSDDCWEKEDILICEKEELEGSQEETPDSQPEENTAPEESPVETSEPKEEDTSSSTEIVKELVCETEEHTHSDSCYSKGSGCEKEEHTHGEGCYEKILSCDAEEHSHGEGCYSSTETMTCSVKEHSHGDDCYDEEGNLTCESEEHSHDNNCYEISEELICNTEEHSHDNSCYTETLTCETEEHTHDNSCAASSELTCETEEHTHDDNCYLEKEIEKEAKEETEEEETTENQKSEEGHVHTEDCYKTETVMTCGEQELHMHDDNCYDKNCFDEDGNLIEGSKVSCGLLQLEEHVHTEECFQVVELAKDEVEGLNCRQLEASQEYKEGILKVIVTYQDTDEIPDDAQLFMELLTEESNAELYQEKMDISNELTEFEEGFEGVLCKLSLYAGEEEIKLQNNVEIEFQFSAEDFKEDSAVKVVRLGEEPEVLESTTLAKMEDGSLSTELEGVSLGQFALFIEDDGLPKGISQKEFIQEYEDWTLKVIATYGEEAQIPKEAKLVVELITEESDEVLYQERIDSARKLSGQHGAFAELLYSIGFYIGEEEIEPKSTVNIEFQMFCDGIEAGTKVSVVHFGDNEAKVLESTDITQNEDGSLSTSFDSDSFSPFAVLIGGSEEVRQTGVIKGREVVYTEADYASDSYDLKNYESEIETYVRIEILEIVSDTNGESWYRYAVLTEDEALKKQLEAFPFVPASDVVLEEGFVQRTLTATDEDGAEITVEGLLPEDAKLSVQKIYDPEIADIMDRMDDSADSECDFGDFRLVYNMELGVSQKLLEPVTITVRNFEFSYKDYSNLSAWVYGMFPVQGNESNSETSANVKTEKIDAEMTEDGRIIFQTEDMATFYIASTLIEGHDEYFDSLAESGDVLTWEDVAGLLEDEDIQEELTEAPTEEQADAEADTASAPMRAKSRAATPTNSAGQIVSTGGASTVKDGVKSSKTIAPTNQENVFDITLTVEAPADTSAYYEDPNMAVVIVMDVSNTMTYKFDENVAPSKPANSRYSAAIAAGNTFINQFYQKCGGSTSKSKIGMVTFNTSARQTFGLQTCTNANAAKNLKEEMKKGIEDIINKEGYGSSDNRFTNIEAGLKRAEAMLDANNNANKYIILVTDGFPTTYIKTGTKYTGYVPKSLNNQTGTSDGIFRDRVANKSCVYGTNYSDKAAIRARTVATAIKKKNIKIFSVGIALGSQSIKGFIDECKGQAYSTVDRASNVGTSGGKTFEIGSASSKAAYKTWLRDKIGSGYYADGNSKENLEKAFESILEEIMRYHTRKAQTVLKVTDPVPNANVEFIGFYNKAGTLQGQTVNLSGSHASGKENTAAFASNQITWTLEKSGYTSTTSGKTITYKYTLKYRVRLKNEASAFVEGKTYVTNGTTTLIYKTSNTVNGNTTHSANKTINFQIPSVKGYLSELSFEKLDLRDEKVVGAEFTLTHDTATCKTCRGNNTSVPATMLKPFKAVSDKNGKVSFTKVPSGHQYILEETKVPEGYHSLGEKYRIKVAYDVQTITKVNANGTTESLTSLTKVVNGNVYKLPETGGSGTSDYIVTGITISLLATALGLGYRRRKGIRGDE